MYRRSSLLLIVILAAHVDAAGEPGVAADWKADVERLTECAIVFEYASDRALYDRAFDVAHHYADKYFDARRMAVRLLRREEDAAEVAFLAREDQLRFFRRLAYVQNDDGFRSRLKTCNETVL